MLAYVLAVGWQPSVVRAGVAGALASLAWLASRPRDRWHFLRSARSSSSSGSRPRCSSRASSCRSSAVAAIFVLVPRLRRVARATRSRAPGGRRSRSRWRAARHRADRVAALRRRRALDRPGERACRAGDAGGARLGLAAAAAAPSCRRRRWHSPGSPAGSGVACALRADVRRPAVRPGADPVSRSPCWRRRRRGRVVAQCARAGASGAGVEGSRRSSCSAGSCVATRTAHRCRRRGPPRHVPRRRPGRCGAASGRGGAVLVDQGPPEARVASSCAGSACGRWPRWCSHIRSATTSAARQTCIGSLAWARSSTPGCPRSRADESDALGGRSSAARRHRARPLRGRVPARPPHAARALAGWPGSPGTDPNDRAVVLLASCGAADVFLPADAESNVTAPLPLHA